jgi:hypothetical protein
MIGALLGALVAGGLGQEAGAVLNAVSPVLDPLNLFPVWYQDTNFLPVELCKFTNGLCNVIGVPDPILGVTVETFYTDVDVGPAKASFSLPDGTPLGSLFQVRFAIEGAFAPPGNIIAGQQVVFGRNRIHLTILVPGEYTVTYPFGVRTVVVTVPGPRAFLITEDIPALPAVVGVPPAAVPDPLFSTGALASNGGFLYWDSGLPVLDPAGVAGANFYLGNPLVAHTIFGSPTGTNFFQVDYRPLGAGGNPTGVPITVFHSDQFFVVGKIFTGPGTAAPTLGNTAPTMVDDPGPAGPPIGTGKGLPLTIDVLANDVRIDMPINPTTLAPTASAAGGTVVKTPFNDRMKVTYTPPPTFVGTDTFTYTVQSFTGTPATSAAANVNAAAATVTVFVEDLVANQADYRLKIAKWDIGGTSSATVPTNTITIHLGPDLAGPVIGTAVVQANGKWLFEGKSTLLPAGVSTVSIVSSNSVSKLAIPLRLR